LLNREDGVENNLIMDSDSLTTSKIAEYIEEEINEANIKEKRVKVSLE
jgi:flavodoxin